MGILRALFGTKQTGTAGRFHSVAPAPDLGLVRGRHYTEWIEHVKQLKREKKHQEVIDLCLEAVAACEEEGSLDKNGVPPWWYEQVALGARRTDQPAVERSAMERYLARPGGKNPEYVKKFEQALSKLDASEGTA